MKAFFFSSLVLACRFSLPILIAISACGPPNSLGQRIESLPTGADYALNRHGLDGRYEGSPLLAVSNYTGSNITVYDATSGGDPPPKWTLKKRLYGPQGMATDAKGDLYVADADETWIDEYQSGSNVPSVRLDTGKDYCPVDVVVGANDTVYAAVDNCSQKPTFVGRLLEFSAGSKKPTVTVKTPHEVPSSVALDNNGNVYLGENPELGGSSGRILEFAPGSRKGTNIGINGISFVGGIAFDSQDSLYVVDRVNSLINEYPKGSTNPKLTITNGLSFPNYIAIDSDDVLYVANVNGGDASAYQSGATSPFETFNKGMNRPEGVALLPSW